MKKLEGKEGEGLDPKTKTAETGCGRHRQPTLLNVRCSSVSKDGGQVLSKAQSHGEDKG